MEDKNIDYELLAYYDKRLKEFFEFTEHTPTTIAVGGLPKGSTFHGVSLREMFLRMLYPELAPKLPKYTNPSSTISNLEGLVEVGTAWSAKAIKVNFDRGDIDPYYTSTGEGTESSPYAGLPSLYILRINGNSVGMEETPTLSHTFSVNFTFATEFENTVEAEVAYTEGILPYNSKGEPLPAAQLTEGSVQNSLKVEAVYRLYATQTNGTAQPLELMSKTTTSFYVSVFNELDESDPTKRQSVWIPVGWGTWKIQLKDLTGNWVDAVAFQQEVVQLNGLSYTRHYNDMPDYQFAGDKQLKIVKS